MVDKISQQPQPNQTQQQKSAGPPLPPWMDTSQQPAQQPGQPKQANKPQQPGVQPTIEPIVEKPNLVSPGSKSKGRAKKMAISFLAVFLVIGGAFATFTLVKRRQPEVYQSCVNADQRCYSDAMCCSGVCNDQGNCVGDTPPPPEDPPSCIQAGGDCNNGTCCSGLSCDSSSKKCVMPAPPPEDPPAPPPPPPTEENCKIVQTGSGCAGEVCNAYNGTSCCLETTGCDQAGNVFEARKYICGNNDMNNPDQCFSGGSCGSGKCQTGSDNLQNSKKVCLTFPLPECRCQQIDLRVLNSGGQIIADGNLMSQSSDWSCGGTQKPSPSPSLPPDQSLVCSSLSRNPATDLTIGDSVTFTCVGTASLVTINHYEFRLSSDGGATYSVISNNSTTGTTNYTIAGSGDYVVQCRVCSSVNSANCTTWGQTGGWVAP